MTNVPDAPAKNPAPDFRTEICNWCEAWETCLRNVLSQVSGQPIAFEISAEPLPAADSDLWYTVVAGGAVHGEMTLRLPAASGTRLAQKFLGETAPAAVGITPEPITAEHKEALEKLLRQIAGLAATALASTAGGEVQFHLSSSSAPSWSSDAIVCLQTRDEAGTSVTLEIQISPALAAALQPRVQPAQPSPPPSTEPPPSSSYRRLMDVGLDVKLRFGTRRMLLRDVLALSAGVVVELENALHSPVDLLLDGRLIAQGDVVVVDGKYGLRITDVVDPAPAAGSPG
ncbi:MAG TPA: flagellar motor switch protein FliN [Terriglobales bacterium]|jgi:flagellar motor switch protein FliN